MHHKRALDTVMHRVAGFGPLLFFTVATIEGFMRAQYHPIAEPISALALGPRGWVQELNFVVLAASFFSFAAVLKMQLRDGVASMAGPGIFWIMTIGVTLAATFPMDARDATPTLIGRLHVLGGFMVFPWMPTVLLLLARRFRADVRWRPYFRYSLLTGLFCLATMIFFLIFVGPPGSSPRLASSLAGLVQRVQILPFFTWMALVARRAYRFRQELRWEVERLTLSA